MPPEDPIILLSRLANTLCENVLQDPSELVGPVDISDDLQEAEREESPVCKTPILSKLSLIKEVIGGREPMLIERKRRNSDVFPLSSMRDSLRSCDKMFSGSRRHRKFSENQPSSTHINYVETLSNQTNSGETSSIRSNFEEPSSIRTNSVEPSSIQAGNTTTTTAAEPNVEMNRISRAVERKKSLIDFCHALDRVQATRHNSQQPEN